MSEPIARTNFLI